MSSVWQVSTTTGDRELAGRIATELVDRQLAACVQVSGPVESTYRWQGKIERTEEWICTAKTLEEHFPAVEKLISELHPYDVPELIATPIVAGSEAYLSWLRTEVSKPTA